MKYALLSQFEKLFHRSPFKAVEDMLTMTADEQRWFVWTHRHKADPTLELTAVDEWETNEVAEAVGDFFGVSTSLIPSSQTFTEPSVS